MCKKYSAESFITEKGQFEKIKDLRVHAEMYPTDAQNVYKSCLAGLRRQSY